MAAKSNNNSNDRKFTDPTAEGYFPFDPDEHEEWDGAGRKPPTGEYTAEITAMAGKKDGSGIRVDTQFLTGPDDTDDMKGVDFSLYFNFGEKSGNFLKGFLGKVCPEAMMPENMGRGPKGKGINFALLSGGKDGKGAVIKMTLFEEWYEDRATGERKSAVKPDLRTISLISPSSKVAALQGAASGEGSDQWQPAS